jgi:ABC-type antimicrobial peptide transport system permease subunit
VRLALGATPSATLRLVLRQSLGWVLMGLVAGICIALAAGKFVRPLLFQTSPYDPVVFSGSAAVLLLVAVAASLVPAIRASRVDPNVTLRAE